MKEKFETSHQNEQEDLQKEWKTEQRSPDSRPLYENEKKEVLRIVEGIREIANKHFPEVKVSVEGYGQLASSIVDSSIALELNFENPAGAKSKLRLGEILEEIDDKVLESSSYPHYSSKDEYYRDHPDSIPYTVFDMGGSGYNNLAKKFEDERILPIVREHIKNMIEAGNTLGWDPKEKRGINNSTVEELYKYYPDLERFGRCGRLSISHVWNPNKEEKRFILQVSGLGVSTCSGIYELTGDERDLVSILGSNLRSY